jgi:hypothetical protein
MTEDDFNEEVARVRSVYPETRVLEATGSLRPLRIAPVQIPALFWGGGTTRLLVLFDLSSHEATRPPGFLGDEWKLPGGGAPFNASPTYQHGEAWQGYSWTFPWPPCLGVFETVEAYLGRFDDRR